MKEEMITKRILQMDRSTREFLKKYLTLWRSPATNEVIHEFVSLLCSTDEKTIRAITAFFDEITEEA